MSPARARRPALLVGATTVAALLVGLAPSPATPSHAAAPPRKDDPRPAVVALERVQDLLQARSAPATTHRSPGAGAAADHAPGRGLTLALRDLAASKDQLRGEDRQTAERLLTRPSDGFETPYGEPKYDNRPVTRTCSALACVHHVSGGQHQASQRYADRVLAAVTASHEDATSHGFRVPLNDGTRGGDARPDIYLADLDGSYFGYTASEGYRQAGGPFARFGYVVVDNDYDEFCTGGCGGATANRFMKATVAHEYFHLVQFGYDFLEDLWFMEATATWIEDEVFDGVNDNVNYLYSRPSALQTPWVPLDAPRAVPYGNWIWFRHLSEDLGCDVVRKAWERADAWRGVAGTRQPPDEYSVLALRRAVAGEGGAWNRDFAAFAASNRHVDRHYDEGAVYPNAPRASVATLSKGKRRALREFRLSRLASATHQVRPARDLGRGWRLRVVVEGNKARHGGVAHVTIRNRDGSHREIPLHLGGDGRAVTRLPFGRAKVRWVEVTVANASTRNRCWLGNPDTTCQGRSRDNNRPQVLFVKAVR